GLRSFGRFFAFGLLFGSICSGNLLPSGGVLLLILFFSSSFFLVIFLFRGLCRRLLPVARDNTRYIDRVERDTVLGHCHGGADPNANLKGLSDCELPAIEIHLYRAGLAFGVAELHYRSPVQRNGAVD